MTDQPSGNPRWEPTSGRGVPTLPPPTRDAAAQEQAGPAGPVRSGPVGAGPVRAGPVRSMASWLGWCPTRWRAGSSGL